MGLDKMVAVNGLSSEAFASAVSQAFNPLLQDRPWAPLQAKTCDVEHLPGMPLLRPLGPDLDGSKYDFEFLRTHCAVLDVDGKIDTLYIALQHSVPSWDYLRTSNVFLPDLEISSGHDPMLDPTEALEVGQNGGEKDSYSSISTADWRPGRTPAETMVVEALQEHRRRREQAAAPEKPTSSPYVSRLSHSHDSRQQRDTLASNDASSRLRSDAYSRREDDVPSNIISRRVYFQDDTGRLRQQLEQMRARRLPLPHITSAEDLDLIEKDHPMALTDEPPKVRTGYTWRDNLNEINTTLKSGSDSRLAGSHAWTSMASTGAVETEPLVSTMAFPHPTPTIHALQPLKGISLAPDGDGHKIGPDAVWTRIKRNLVSAEVLQEAGLRYEARPDYVAVLGVLSREEIAELARKSVEVRASREDEPPSTVVDQQGRDALAGSPDSAHLTPPTSMSSTTSIQTHAESTRICVRAPHTQQTALDTFFGRLFGYGKVSVLVRHYISESTLLEALY